MLPLSAASSDWLACCVEAPEPFAAKARYALEMLLLPLGLAPRWMARQALPERGVYYGDAAATLASGIVAVPLQDRTVDFFAAPAAYPPDEVGWMEQDGTRWPVLFGTAAEPDLIASAFFWLSGWQEAGGTARDAHGRFPHAASLQARWGLTARPAVDAYRERLAASLAARGLALPRRTWGGAPWALCPTHDIDYLRKWRKGMIYREGVQHALLNRRGDAPPARLHRLGAFLRDALRPGDPYREAFVRMREEVAGRGGTATYFVKAGAHGQHDVPYPTDAPFLKQQLGALRQAGFEVGLHPSYFAHTHPFYLDEEKSRLEAVAEGRIISVRQHYLRYDGAVTPRLQAAAGFQIDSTLGFAEQEGFRHATCLPFLRYDLAANAPSTVWEMPLAVMESALFNRRHLAAEEASAETQKLMQVCRRFGGVAVMLWHNVLWDEMDHPGWGSHFIDALNAAHAGGARIASLREALTGWLGTPSGS